MLACFGLGSAKAFEEPATVTPEETIRNLRNHIERQEKRERCLELKMNALAKEAKEHLAKGDKRGMFSQSCTILHALFFSKLFWISLKTNIFKSCFLCSLSPFVQLFFYQRR